MPYRDSRRGTGRGRSGPRKFGGQRRFGGPRRFGPREMHKITCAECGKEAEVPFKPSGDRPVYCKECFMKRKGIKPREEKEEKEKTEKPEEVEEAKEE
ncbi:MAG: DNA-directed RNA polymerase [Candidatus Pacearchaeota archaeon]|nr:MAG: DNA-directed RNA polymerase [Candidatus Pacearchaeota archaeon]